MFILNNDNDNKKMFELKVLYFGRMCNVALALTNLVGFYVARGAQSELDAYVICLTALVSTLMHLSETKHVLPGIAPFNQYSAVLLWLDRIVAVLVGAYVFSCHYFFQGMIAQRINFLNGDMLIWLGVGVLALTVSERSDLFGWYESPLKTKYMIHTITHAVWHVCVYKTMQSVLINERAIVMEMLLEKQQQ